MCFHYFSLIAINAFNGFPPFSISFNIGRDYNKNALHFFQSLKIVPIRTSAEPYSIGFRLKDHIFVL